MTVIAMGPRLGVKHGATRLPPKPVIIERPRPRFGTFDDLYAHLPAQFILATDATPTGEAKMETIGNMLDITGALVANRWGRGQPMVTRNLDRMRFGPPAKRFDYITSHAEVIHTGPSSVEVAVRLDAHHYKTPQYGSHPVATGSLVYTLLGKTGEPMPQLPSPSPQKAQAEQRRQNRQEEQNELAVYGGAEGLAVTNADCSPRRQVRHQTTLQDVNVHQIVFGGKLLALLYEAGQKAARGFLNVPMRLTRQDRMNFDKPGRIGDVLIAKGSVVRVWSSKVLEVQVDLFAQPKAVKSGWFLPTWLKPASPAQRIASTVLRFTPENSDLNVPDVLPKTPLQEARWVTAGLRQRYLLDEGVEA